MRGFVVQRLIFLKIQAYRAIGQVPESRKHGVQPQDADPIRDHGRGHGVTGGELHIGRDASRSNEAAVQVPPVTRLPRSPVDRDPTEGLRHVAVELRFLLVESNLKTLPGTASYTGNHGVRAVSRLHGSEDPGKVGEGAAEAHRIPLVLARQGPGTETPGLDFESAQIVGARLCYQVHDPFGDMDAIEIVPLLESDLDAPIVADGAQADDPGVSPLRRNGLCDVRDRRNP